MSRGRNGSSRRSHCAASHATSQIAAPAARVSRSAILMLYVSHGLSRRGDMSKFSVVIADDHQLILDGIRNALAPEEDFEVIGEARSGKQVLPLVSRLRPDIVILDLRMPDADGLACLTQIKERFPKTTVVMLSVSTDASLIDAVLRRGASAYVVKSVNPIDLPATLRRAVDQAIDTAIGLPAESSETPANAAGLTERETAILKALARGLSNEAIGKELWIAEQTVKFHLTNIYRKLAVSNRTEAARYAFEQGLVDSPVYDAG